MQGARYTYCLGFLCVFMSTEGAGDMLLYVGAFPSSPYIQAATASELELHHVYMFSAIGLGVLFLVLLVFTVKPKTDNNNAE